jgi:low affinity Fe/Cu permease
MKRQNSACFDETQFCMLLLLLILQAIKNRDGAALQAKIDDLIKTKSDPRDELIGLEDRREEEIQQVRADEERAAAKS